MKILQGLLTKELLDLLKICIVSELVATQQVSIYSFNKWIFFSVESICMERYKRYIGEKVYLTALAPCDAEALTKWHNDPEVAQYSIDFREMKSLLTIRDEVNEVVKSGEAFAIFDKTNDKIIGCSLGCTVMMGEKDYWYTGHDLEALEFLKDFCFNVRNENIVTVSAFSHDTRTLESYTKSGFRKTCVYRQRLIRGRDKYDEIHMDMLATEYWASQRDSEG